MIAPGAWVGVLGGGQLGRMFAAAAQNHGYHVMVLDPDKDCPTSAFADEQIVAAYDDQSAWQKMAERCVGVTTEFENVPADALRFLATRCFVAPRGEHVAEFQDRGLEKATLSAAGLAIAPYKLIDSAEDLHDCDHLLPGILKRIRWGYDGKGQARVKTMAELERAFESFVGPCVLEKQMALAKELSVVVARDRHGHMVSYPTAENRHATGILDTSFAPAHISAELDAHAQSLSRRLAEHVGYVGVLCVELFLLEDDALLVNEIAPRPHNSGHYTVDACTTSQFEQQLRVLIDAPLGDTQLVRPAAMINLMGDLWRDGEPDWPLLLASPHTRLHLYGKREARRGRKMGHYTCLAESSEAALAQAQRIKALLLPREKKAASVG